MVLGAAGAHRRSEKDNWKRVNIWLIVPVNSVAVKTWKVRYNFGSLPKTTSSFFFIVVAVLVICWSVWFERAKAIGTRAARLPFSIPWSCMVLHLWNRSNRCVKRYFLFFIFIYIWLWLIHCVEQSKMDKFRTNQIFMKKKKTVPFCLRIVSSLAFCSIRVFFSIRLVHSMPSGPNRQTRRTAMAPAGFCLRTRKKNGVVFFYSSILFVIVCFFLDAASHTDLLHRMHVRPQRIRRRWQNGVRRRLFIWVVFYLAP